MQPIRRTADVGFSWTREPPTAWEGDAESLARSLERELAGEVGFDRQNRALFATDASNYRQVPIGVVFPRTVDDVVATVAIAREHGAPVLSRGGGTSLAGQCCNVAVVIDFTRHLHRVLEIDAGERIARVEPGCILDDLRDAAQERGLTFGPDPATHTHCTLGGMIGNNSCGVHSVMSGRTDENVHELDVLLYDGTRFTAGPTPEEELARIRREGGRRAEVYERLTEIGRRHERAIRERFPDIPRRVSGYNLPQLLPGEELQLARFLVGSEGTLATTLEATVDLVHWPAKRSLLLLQFEDIYSAADAVPEVMEHGPIGLEGMDERLLTDQVMKGMNPKGRELLGSTDGGWLVVELGADTQEEADEKGRRARSALESLPGVEEAKLFTDPDEQAEVWEIRESGLGATARVPVHGDTWPGWEDSAVPPERMGDYMRELRGLFDEYGYDGAFYGHFGDGCLHTRIDFDLKTAAGLERYHRFVVEAAKLCVGYGGALSGEHGDGQCRGELLPLMFGEEVARAFREVKAVFDPGNRMNPGKVCEPYPILSNLRLGTDYRPWEPETAFRYPDDDFRFSRSAARCVGVGKCRRLGKGTMCPSYRVTREEKHSTRGRAHLLWEMLEGGVVGDGWGSGEVADALDLCLACKACKSECPVGVDMATYKAEFLYHHYKRTPRPVVAYSMGLVHWWARLASLAPRLVNAVTHLPGVSDLVKELGGIAPERQVPRFATETFRAWFAGHEPAHPEGRPVVLYPDTFTDHFHPEIGRAAVEVLEAAGYRVEIPEKILCCGRPLYDYGFLPLARRLLEANVEALAGAVRGGVPVVGLEPSCVATFRDELGEMLPHDEDAARLSGCFHTLAELLDREPGSFPFPRLERRAMVHGHCHQASVMGLDAEERVLGKLGLDFERLDSGCCGMAGSFGFEAEKYEVSMAVGEEKLLPAVRGADVETILVADGFSCRTQVEQATERRGLHVAQVLRMALRERAGAGGPPGERPERGDARSPSEARQEPALGPKAARGAVWAAGGVAAVLGAWVGWKVLRGGGDAGGERFESE